MFSILTDGELFLLDQVGGLPVIKKNMELFSAVETHVLSLEEPHRGLFLRALEKENAKVKKRIDKTLKDLEHKAAEEEYKRRIERKKEEEEYEDKYRERHSIDVVMAAVRELNPECCGLRIKK
ncbi:MAG: hypothetical protein GF334_01300 [Candidatus Altiarchaeales archaeon]|nr:hypothetical protein [Candidatus Altiarchaeales archaeon]